MKKQRRENDARPARRRFGFSASNARETERIVHPRAINWRAFTAKDKQTVRVLPNFDIVSGGADGAPIPGGAASKIQINVRQAQ